MKQQFHAGEIITVITGRCVAPDGLPGIKKLLDFMTGDKIQSTEITRVMKVCAPHLKKQFPQFNTPEFEIEITELIEMLKSESGKAEPELLIRGWLGQIGEKYGETFEVEDLEFYEMRDPIEEAIEMFGEEKVIAVTVD
jgi:hypothetical protein